MRTSQNQQQQYSQSLQHKKTVEKYKSKKERKQVKIYQNQFKNNRRSNNNSKNENLQERKICLKQFSEDIQRYPSSQEVRLNKDRERNLRYNKKNDSGKISNYYKKNQYQLLVQSKDSFNYLKRHNQDEEVMLPLDQKKANKWWNKLDDMFFKTIQGGKTVKQMKKALQQKFANQVGLSEESQFIDKNIGSISTSMNLYSTNSKGIPTNNNNISSSFVSLNNVENNFDTRTYAQIVLQDECPYLSNQKLIRILIKTSYPSLETIEQKLKLEQQSKKMAFFEIFDSQQNQKDIELVNLINNQQFIKRVQFYNQQLPKKKDYVRQIDFQLHLWQSQLQRIERQNMNQWVNLQKNVQKVKQRQNFQYTLKKIPRTYEKTFEQTENIMNVLTWGNILRFFQQGLNNKTQKQADFYKESLNQNQKKPKKQNSDSPIKKHEIPQSKDKQQNIDKQQPSLQKNKKKLNKKKWYQTDCKICFCGLNPDSNQILYCDHCNTSFHRACYGLRAIPQDQHYFCDSCHLKKILISQYKLKLNGNSQKTFNGMAQFKSASSFTNNQPNLSTTNTNTNNNLNIRPIICQICYKPNFPIKNINGHYYHITCLMIFNYISLKDNHFILRQEITPQKIVQDVINNQIQNYNYCQYCISHNTSSSSSSITHNSSFLGMKMVCNHQGCLISLHPICAYLYGCKFQVKRKQIQNRNKTQMKQKRKVRLEETFLDVKIYCKDHAYYNKETSNLSQEKQILPSECLSQIEKNGTLLRNIKKDSSYLSFSQQIYFRRLLCNVKETSNKTFNQFLQSFNQQQQKLLKSKKLIKNSFLIGLTIDEKILYKTKFLKKYLIKKLFDNQEIKQNIKQKEKIKSSAKSINKQEPQVKGQIQTETSKILQIIKKQQQKQKLKQKQKKNKK